MKNDSQVVSVNLGRREKVRIGKKLVETGIFKHPVTDIVKVTEQGLVNDVVANTTHHGGRDQAIYLYSGEDYQWWSKVTQSNLLPGTFGENLTLSTLQGCFHHGKCAECAPIMIIMHFLRFYCISLPI